MLLTLTNVTMLLVLLLIPSLNSISFTINYMTYSLLNKPFFFDFSTVTHNVFSIALILIFFILVMYSRVYLKGSYNYPYFEYVYNIFFTAMLLLLCSSNMITTLVA